MRQTVSTNKIDMDSQKISLKIESWISEIGRITRDFQEMFGNLTDEQLNWKPDEDTWSIAQNMDHLIVINSSYLLVLRCMRKGNYEPPFFGKFRFISKLMGKAMMKSVQPDRKKKTKTFKIWEPASGEKITDILKKFKAHQEELKRQIRKSENLLTQGAIIASPANRNIVYPLETAFEMMITHEQRHFIQAKEVWENLSF